jgi:hypothetical protein
VTSIVTAREYANQLERGTGGTNRRMILPPDKLLINESIVPQEYLADCNATKYLQAVECRASRGFAQLLKDRVAVVQKTTLACLKAFGFINLSSSVIIGPVTRK